MAFSHFQTFCSRVCSVVRVVIYSVRIYTKNVYVYKYGKTIFAGNRIRIRRVRLLSKTVKQNCFLRTRQVLISNELFEFFKPEVLCFSPRNALTRYISRRNAVSITDRNGYNARRGARHPLSSRRMYYNNGQQLRPRRDFEIKKIQNKTINRIILYYMYICIISSTNSGKKTEKKNDLHNYIYMWRKKKLHCEDVWRPLY